MIAKLKSWFYGLPILKKLFVLLITGSILPLTATSAYSYLSARSQLLKQACENMDHTNRQINNNVNNQMGIFLQMSGLLYTNSTLKTYLTWEYDKALDFVSAYGYINDLFFGMMASNAYISEICVYVPNETLPADGVFIHHLNNSPQTPQWIYDLSKIYGANVYTKVYLDEKGQGFLTLGRNMDFGNIYSSYGVLTLTFEENSLFSMIEQESKGCDIFILDESGTILSTRDKSLLTRNMEEFIGQKLPDYDGYEIIDVSGKKSLVVCNSMERGWKTVSIVPLDELLQGTHSTATKVLIVAVLCFLLTFALMMLISHYFNTRITSLTKQIDMIEREDFSRRIPIRGNDEIGRLALSLNDMTNRLDQLINELYKKEIARKDTELYALQSQINPHFLYNTLSVISSLAIRKGDHEISTIINHLASFYKTSLNKGKRYISVEDELELTKHYIAIQHMRFREQFQESYELDQTLYPCRTLKLVLQPFIENAINHATSARCEPLHIVIRLYRIDGKIYYEIEDDGAGMTPECLLKLNSRNTEAGFGIYNVSERIRLAYGEEYGVTVESILGKGTKICICIPM